MKKIDKVIWRETAYVAAWVLILSALMEAVFLIGGWWMFNVLWGNLLGGGVAVLNFFLMAITVQIALSKDPKDAKSTIKLSFTLRNMMLVLAMVVGFLLSDYFNMIALLVPMLFPSVAVKVRPMFMKAEEKVGDNADE